MPGHPEIVQRFYVGMMANEENCKTCGEERKHDAKTGWYCPDCERERLKREVKEAAIMLQKIVDADNDETIGSLDCDIVTTVGYPRSWLKVAAARWLERNAVLQPNITVERP